MTRWAIGAPYNPRMTRDLHTTAAALTWMRRAFRDGGWVTAGDRSGIEGCIGDHLRPEAVEHV